jgi:osmotically-inducible protein OsmY
MKTLIIFTALMVGATGAIWVYADPPIDSNTSHLVAYVKDSAIAMKVKTKLAAKNMSTLTNIKVDTYNHGIVWLSGKAPTKDASNVAEMIAKDTDGVTTVHNEVFLQR